jgi:UDP-N-acetylmuramoylalanine--D-glutamate ligase
MQTKTIDYKEFFKGKKITVMGLGLLGGIGDICFLAEAGADLIVTDLKSKEDLRASLLKLKKFKNIKYTLRGHDLRDFNNRDLIIKAPSTPLDSVYIKEAEKNGITVTMWAALFSKFAMEIGAKIVGVTGTRGKTTTTLLIYEILKIAKKKVIQGGNIQGTSLLSQLSTVTSDTIVVLELDSWKLQGFASEKISPNIAVFTNFLSDHMNYYNGDVKQYFMDKAGIFKYQTNKDLLIVGEQVYPLIKKWGGLSAQAGKIKSKIIVPKLGLPKGWVVGILGEHNKGNAVLAVEVARKLGVSDEIIKKTLAGFNGAPGRMELVREIKGVKYYNDTTATTPDATVAALRALGQDRDIVLIAGGFDKGLVMDAVVNEIPKYCKGVILLSGSGTDRIKSDLKNCVEVDSLKKAVKIANEIAKKGDIVLLSPAFASFGMFKNEYDRGDQFNKIVKNLK